MHSSPYFPSAQLFVCANARAASDPLGAGCGARGEAVFAAMKRDVAKAGLLSRLWVTKTHCLGLCPRVGAAVAVYPRGEVLVEVEESDAAAIVQTVIAELPPR